MKLTNIFLLILIASIAFNGCTVREYYKPKDGERASQIKFSGKLEKPLVATTREAGVLKDGKILFRDYDDVISPIVLEKNQKLLHRDRNIYMIQDDCKDIVLLDVISKYSIKVPMDKCVLSASFTSKSEQKGDALTLDSSFILALLGIDNSVMVFEGSREEFSQTLSPVLAASSLIAKPIFTKTNIILPTLDGKILIYDLKKKTIVKDIMLQGYQELNHIIYLYNKNDLLLAATRNSINIITADNKTLTYAGEFRDVRVYEDKNNKDRIYVLTNEGDVVELDFTLQVLKKHEFEYARLSGMSISRNHMYILERNKFLIDLNLATFKAVVYKVKLKKNKKLFYTDKAIFYDKKFKEF